MQILDTISQKLTEMLGPFGPLMALGMLGVLLILLVLPALLNKDEDPLEKLKSSNQASQNRTEGTRLRVAGGKDKLEKYSDFLEPKNQEEFSSVKLKLLQAGYRSKNAVRMYHFSQFALGLGFLVLGGGYAVFNSSTGDPDTTVTMLSVLGPGIAGYMLPKYWVTRRQGERQEQMVNGFPDSLDMMLVCVEAGQSLDQAIIRVARELESGFPALADEYKIVSHEMKAGKDKTQVLRDMSERAGCVGHRQLRHCPYPVAAVRHLDRRGAAGLLGRDARQARHAGRGKGQQTAHKDDARDYDADPAAAADHPDWPLGLRDRGNVGEFRSLTGAAKPIAA